MPGVATSGGPGCSHGSRRRVARGASVVCGEDQYPAVAGFPELIHELLNEGELCYRSWKLVGKLFPDQGYISYTSPSSFLTESTLGNSPKPLVLSNA